MTYALGGTPIAAFSAVLNGSKPGLRTWLIVGTHGDEIERVWRLSG